MFMKDNGNKRCVLYCDCGCENGVILKTENDENGYYISLVSDIYYTSHKTGWSRFKERCKRIWRIIRNKEYYYFEICIHGDDIKEFKKFVENM